MLLSRQGSAERCFSACIRPTGGQSHCDVRGASGLPCVAGAPRRRVVGERLRPEWDLWAARSGASQPAGPRGAVLLSLHPPSGSGGSGTLRHRGQHAENQESKRFLQQRAPVSGGSCGCIFYVFLRRAPFAFTPSPHRPDLEVCRDKMPPRNKRSHFGSSHQDTDSHCPIQASSFQVASISWSF